VTLLDQARAESVRTGPTPAVILAVRNAPKKLRDEVLDVIEAAVGREIPYTVAARVIGPAIGIDDLKDERVRQHGPAILTEYGR
jgi:hypothetical protein